MKAELKFNKLTIIGESWDEAQQLEKWCDEFFKYAPGMQCFEIVYKDRRICSDRLPDVSVEESV